MRRDLLFMLPLVWLLATATAQTDKKPAAEHAAGAAKTQIKKEAVSGQKEEAQAKTKAPQEATVEAQAETKKGETGQTDQPDPKLTSVPGGNALGMSVLGNQEAPTSLVIVPWKSSEVGRATGISPMLDDSRQPVDKEVFMRELRYYEIRSEKKQ